jgi:hypothetical protein
METNSWKTLTFNYPVAVPTMIPDEEKKYLYWLGKEVWSGNGAVIEIGPWLGGSTVCLAAGMQASGNDTHKRLHVYDNFIWREFMAERALLPLQSGDSFEDFFLKNIGNYKDVVQSYVRALPDESIEGNREAEKKRFRETEKVPLFEGFTKEPIEILFIDGAKSLRGMRHLLQVLGSQFIIDKTLVVCQDYKYWGTYWVPLVMTRLKKYFEPVHNVLNGTTVTFRLTSGLSSAIVSELEDDIKILQTTQAIRELDLASSMLSKEGDTLGAFNVRLSKVSFLIHQNKVPEAVEEFKNIQKSWPVLLNSYQLDRAREYLSAEKSCTLPRSMILQLFHLVNNFAGKIRELTAGK